MSRERIDIPSPTQKADFPDKDHMLNTPDYVKIRQRINISDNTEKVIIGFGPCRSGTTASLRVFSEAGIPAVYQPGKAIHRLLVSGEKASTFYFPDKQIVYFKETMGPHTEAESNFDPYELYMPLLNGKEVSTILFMRRPDQVYDSYRRVFGTTNKERLKTNLILGYLNALKVMEKFERDGIQVIPFAQEVLKEGQVDVVRNLFSLIGCSNSFHKGIVTDWTNVSEDSIIYPSEPEYNHSEAHGEVRSSTGLRYIDRQVSLSDADMKFLEESGIIDIYESILIQTYQKLK